VSEDRDWHIDLVEPRLVRDAEGFDLVAGIRFEPSPAMIEALERGVTLTVAVQTRATGGPVFVPGFDRIRKHRLEISYLPLSRHYQLVYLRDDSHSSYPRLGMLINALEDPQPWSVKTRGRRARTRPLAGSGPCRAGPIASALADALPSWFDPQWRVRSRWQEWSTAGVETMPRKTGWRRLLRAIPLAAVLIILLSSLYLVSSVEQEATQLGRLAMWIIVLTGISVLILLAVIIGRLVKLIQRLRAGEVGARLTARLVAVFVILTLPPVVVLYLFAIQFMTDTIDGWMDVEAEQALADSIELGQMFMDIRTREVRGQITRLAERLDLSDDDRLFGQLLRQISSAGPTELSVLDGGGRAEVMVSIDPGLLVADRPNDFALVQALQNQEYAAAEPTEDGIQIRV
jgi:hypothetical protein